MAEKQIIDAMWDDSPVDVSTEVNFIWSIANKLRGTYQSDKYKDFDDIDDALIEGLSQNQDFFSLLLTNDEIKHQVLGIFSDEIYKSLRNS